MTVQRVCLIQTPSRHARPLSRSMMGGLGFGTDAETLLPPLELMVLAAVLRQEGRDVCVLDADADRMDATAAAGAIREFHADAALATVSLPTLNADCVWIREVTEKAQVRIFIKTFIREEKILEEILTKSGSDCVLVGEPDFLLLPVLEGRSNAGTARRDSAGRIAVTPYEPIASLDDLPIAARDLLPHGRYRYPLLGTGVTGMQTSRGCPYPCGYYCPYPMVEGKTWRPMSPERVVREMRAIESGGIKNILFRDATFTLNRDRIVDICARLVSSGPRLSWWCETRADLLDPDLLQKMAAAGCRGVNVGVESGNDDLIHTIGKRGLTLDRLGLARRSAASAGVRMHFLMQVGLPGETRRTILDTLDLLRNLKPDSIGLTYTTPYPGTDLYRDAVDRRWLDAKSWEDFDAHTPILRTADLTAADLVFGRRMIETGYALIRQDAPSGRWRDFYIDALKWVYGLGPGILQAGPRDPVWKRLLKPFWRVIPEPIRQKIRAACPGLFRRTL